MNTLHERAIRAIEELFSAEDNSQAQVLEMLKNIQENVEEKIEVLDAELRDEIPW